MTATAQPLVEILYVDDCPNLDGARELVARVAADVGGDVQVRLVRIADADAAVRQRFPGSPTIRVDGRDIEPGADARDASVLACRVYRRAEGLEGQPEEAWLRRALTEARSDAATSRRC
jgi:hypothetical protein